MNNPEILIYEPIGEGGSTAAKFAEKLAAAGPGPVTVRVNSPGGCTMQGLAIYNLIQQHGNVTVIVDGLAASAASYLILGAKRIKIAPDALLMIHAPHTSGISGEADDLREVANLLDRTEKQIAGVYVRRTGKTAEQVNSWLSGQTWFTADEAKASGLVDEIIAPDPSRQNVKLAYMYSFDSAPAAIAARFKVSSPAVVVDPIKAELETVKSELVLAKLREKIGNRLDAFLGADLRSALIQFSIRNESLAEPLLAALNERKRFQEEISQLQSEITAVNIITPLLKKRTVTSNGEEYDAYMSRLNNSRK